MEDDPEVATWNPDHNILANAYGEHVYKAGLLRRINSFRKDSAFSDVVIFIDGTLFYAHRLVLSAASQVFYAMLTADMKEKCEGRIDLSHSFIKPGVFSELLEYVYTGKIHISNANVEDLMMAANFFMLAPLTKMCCEHLQGALSPDNCLGIISLAKRFGCHELKKKADNVLKAEFMLVLKSEEFVSLNCGDLQETIQNDGIEVSGEEDILHGLIRWVKHLPHQRLKYFPSLLKSVRLQYVKPDIIDDYVTKDSQIEALCRESNIANFICEAKVAWECRERCNELLQVGGNFLPRNCLNRKKVILGCGGYDGGKCTHVSFAISSDSFQTHYLAFMNISKHDHGVAVLDNKLHVIGGFNSFRGPLSVVEVYNPSRNSWQIANPMNSKRKSLGVCTLNNKIYASGGLDANYASLKSMEVFDPYTNTWEYVAPMAEPKYAHSLVSDGRYIYAVGGWKSNKMERYDPETNSWIWLPSMQMPRAGPGAVVLGRNIYVTGGYGDSSCTNSVEMYNLDEGKWEVLASMSVPRWRSGIVALDNKVLVVGGRDSHWRYLDLIEVYDTETRTWTLQVPLPLQVMGLRCCVIDIPVEHLSS